MSEREESTASRYTKTEQEKRDEVLHTEAVKRKTIGRKDEKTRREAKKSEPEEE